MRKRLWIHRFQPICSPAAWQLFAAMAAGDTLKVHRTVDGAKENRLHALNGEHSQDIASTLVDELRACGLIESNLKFPAATYLLTAKGRTEAMRLGNTRAVPLSARDAAPTA